jgi:hypothetical protein
MRATDAVLSRQDDDFGPLNGALVEVDHILVNHADAARRHVGADGLRLGRTVDAIAGSVAALKLAPPELRQDGVERGCR